MAAKKRNRNKSKSTQAASTNQQPADQTSSCPTDNAAGPIVEKRDRFTAKPWLTATLLLAAVWWVSLSLLTLVSANPTTVNRRQVAESDIVVIGTIKDLNKGLVTVTVTRQWIDPNPQTELTVSGLLNEFDLKTGESVVMPLTGGPDGTFQLTRVQQTNLNPAGTTYIYPATDSVLKQVERFAKIH